MGAIGLLAGQLACPMLYESASTGVHPILVCSQLFAETKHMANHGGCDEANPAGGLPRLEHASPGASTRPSVGARPGVGARPSVGARPGAGTRPSVGARPGAGTRPGVGTRPGGVRPSPGSGRPTQGQLQQFLNLPGTGGPATRPGVKDRPGIPERPDRSHRWVYHSLGTCRRSHAPRPNRHVIPAPTQ